MPKNQLNRPRNVGNMGLMGMEAKDFFRGYGSINGAGSRGMSTVQCTIHLNLTALNSVTLDTLNCAIHQPFSKQSSVKRNGPQCFPIAAIVPKCHRKMLTIGTAVQAEKNFLAGSRFCVKFRKDFAQQ